MPNSIATNKLRKVVDPCAILWIKSDGMALRYLPSLHDQHWHSVGRVLASMVRKPSLTSSKQLAVFGACVQHGSSHTRNNPSPSPCCLSNSSGLTNCASALFICFCPTTPAKYHGCCTSTCCHYSAFCIATSRSTSKLERPAFWFRDMFVKATCLLD